jgi:hypothetical protein
VFLAELGRLESLLQILPHVGTLPGAAIDLLENAADPDSASLEVAIEVIFETGDAAALDVFADQARNPEQDTGLVADWFRDPLLRHRAEPAVIRMSVDLLTRPGLDRERKNALVEALFDYRPLDWYLSPAADHQVLPAPPPSDQISPEGRELLTQLAEFVVADDEIAPVNRTLAADFVSQF